MPHPRKLNICMILRALCVLPTLVASTSLIIEVEDCLLSYACVSVYLCKGVCTFSRRKMEHFDTSRDVDTNTSRNISYNIRTIAKLIKLSSYFYCVVSVHEIHAQDDHPFIIIPQPHALTSSIYNINVPYFLAS